MSISRDVVSTNESFVGVVDRFSAAVGGLLPGATVEALAQLHSATGDLLMAVSHNATVMAAGVLTPLLGRLTELERRIDQVRRHSDGVQRTADARIDHLIEEQIDPAQLRELIALLYGQATQVSDHERRITALEQQLAGGADGRA